MLDETRSKLDGLIGSLTLWAHGADVITRFARGEALNDEEERLLHLVTHAGLRVGEPLLRAEDAQDHFKRIDAAVWAPDLLHIATIGLRWVQGPALIVPSLRPAKPALTEVFGRGAVPYLDIGDDYAALLISAFWRRSAHMGGSEIHIRAADLQGFLDDPALPPAVGAAARNALASVACFTAMALAVVTRRDVRPVIAATLAERWAAGQASLLGLLWSLPGALPEGVTPGPGWLIDLEKLFAEASEHAERLRAHSPPEGFGPPQGFGPPRLV